MDLILKCIFHLIFHWVANSLMQPNLPPGIKDRQAEPSTNTFTFSHSPLSPHLRELTRRRRRRRSTPCVSLPLSCWWCLPWPLRPVHDAALHVGLLTRCKAHHHGVDDCIVQHASLPSHRPYRRRGSTEAAFSIPCSMSRSTCPPIQPPSAPSCWRLTPRPPMKPPGNGGR